MLTQEQAFMLSLFFENSNIWFLQILQKILILQLKKLSLTWIVSLVILSANYDIYVYALTIKFKLSTLVIYKFSSLFKAFNK